ncbi:MAG: hypothetical protein LUK37_23155 [Clostridia bacterium]|nr:hypothetical protein [Clostridia bacterium]
MGIQEELRIRGYQSAVEHMGTDEGSIFAHWIQKHGYQNMPFVCSLAYNLGRVHGIRDERARKKKTA